MDSHLTSENDAKKLTFRSIMPTTPSGKNTARVLALATVLFATWYVDRRRKRKKAGAARGMAVGPDSTNIDLTPKYGDDRRKRDVVEQASWESFPASDPPAY